MFISTGPAPAGPFVAGPLSSEDWRDKSQVPRLPIEIWRASLGDKGQNKAPPETVGASAHLNGEHGRSGVEAEAA